ncbi:MAG: hypothetical protein MRY83_15145 [Flavobacteriales bacterium]|nr:hypothetical protein [Flavobacteriales bacterium]
MRKMLFAVAFFTISTISFAKKVVLPEGTIIKMRLIENVDTRLAQSGDLVRFEVLEDVKVKKKIVIEKGSIAYGRLSTASHGRLLSKSNLSLTIEYVRAVDDHNVKLNYQASQNHPTKKGIVKSVLHRQITLHKGSEFEPFVSKDTKIKV